MKRYNIHGIISIALCSIALIIGLVSVSIHSPVHGILSLLLTITAFVVVSGIYCSKCRCREKCNHFFIGKLSIRLSKGSSKPYKTSDIIWGLLPMMIAVLFPQFWLVKTPMLLVGFWLFLIVGGLEVYYFVCNRCMNYKCKMCRNRIITLKSE